MSKVVRPDYRYKLFL